MAKDMLYFQVLDDALLERLGDRYKKHRCLHAKVDESGVISAYARCSDMERIGSIENGMVVLEDRYFNSLLCLGFHNPTLSEISTHLGRTAVFLGEIPDVVVDLIFKRYSYKLDLLPTVKRDKVLITEPYSGSPAVARVIDQLNYIRKREEERAERERNKDLLGGAESNLDCLMAEPMSVFDR